MAKFTITPPKYITPENVDEKFNKLGDNWWQTSEIRENIRNLIAKNNILPQNLDLDNILQLKDLCNHQKYKEFLNRRNKFLEKHQIMDANEFVKLFWNKDLKNKEIDDNTELISGKYNKSDINQWKLWICVFDTFLKQLKETPFFETLIRCSLQRNEKNDWWKCLIPLCNDEWKYEEIFDEDINYLKNSEYEGKELLSHSSLWFNIMETLLVKMIWKKKKYPNLWIGSEKFQIRSKIIPYDNLQTLSPEELYGNTYWIRNYNAYKYILWDNVVKQGYSIQNFSDNEIEWLIKLTETWIIKLTTWAIDTKINNYIKNNIASFNKPVINDNIDDDSNEKILNERWYPLKILHEAWPNEDISIWRAEKLWATFKIKWTNERFIQSHAYSIEGMHKKDGETFVTIINPRYTWKKIDVPLKYIKEFFSISIYWFDFDKMFVENPKNHKK